MVDYYPSALCCRRKQRRADNHFEGGWTRQPSAWHLAVGEREERRPSINSSIMVDYYPSAMAHRQSLRGLDAVTFRLALSRRWKRRTTTIHQFFNNGGLLSVGALPSTEVTAHRQSIRGLDAATFRLALSRRWKRRTAAIHQFFNNGGLLSVGALPSTEVTTH